MRAKVIVAYHDRLEHRTYKVGETITLTEERYTELHAKGFVEKAASKKEDKQGAQRITKEEKSTTDTK